MNTYTNYQKLLQNIHHNNIIELKDLVNILMVAQELNYPTRFNNQVKSLKDFCYERIGYCVKTLNMCQEEYKEETKRKNQIFNDNVKNSKEYIPLIIDPTSYEFKFINQVTVSVNGKHFIVKSLLENYNNKEKRQQIVKKIKEMLNGSMDFILEGRFI